MYLKQIKIAGFKSFADSHTITFNRGLTAIVGPNGCGKSNIIDSIRWVLGEQKVKSLRSEKMEDVIFSGTIMRKPHNFAEVTLTIENDDKALPIDCNTVHITRRIFRSGESEYLINKKLCRLKDITALFFDTGMGIGSYSLMEQKMIDTILSDKDEERRIMFEEAAGINKYRSQRKEALRNLLRTSDDLNRISDIVLEKEKTMKMLARHVSKAEKFREFKGELTDLDVAFCNGIFLDVSGKLKIEGHKHATLVTNREKLSAEISTSDVGVEEKELYVLEKEEKWAEINRELSTLTDKLHEVESSIVARKEKSESSKRAIAQLKQYQEKLTINIEKLKNEHSVLESQIIQVETRICEAEEEYQSSKRDSDDFEISVAEKKLELNKINAKRITIMEDESDLRSRIEKYRSTLDNLLENKMNVENTILVDKKRIDECIENINNCKENLKQANVEFESLSSSRDILIKKISSEEEHYREILEEEKNVEASLLSDEKQLEFFEDMKKNHEGYKDAVRSVIEGDISGISGIIADVIDVKDEYVIAIESALGSRAQYILADTENSAFEAIDHLKDGKLGKASFIACDMVQKTTRPNNLDNLLALDGVLGWADDCVTFQKEYDKLASLLLGDVLLISDSSVVSKVKELAEGFSLFCVTPEGDSYATNGVIRGGKFGNEELGLLGRTKLIESLKENIKEHKITIEIKAQEKRASLQTLEDAKQALFTIDEKLNSGRRIKQEHEGNIRHLDEEVERLKTREHEALEQLHILNRRFEENKEEELLANKDAQRLEERKVEVNSSILLVSDELENFEKERLQKLESVRASELRFNSLKQEMATLKQNFQKTNEEVEYSYNEVAEGREKENNFEIEIENFEKEVQNGEVLLDELRINKREKEQNGAARREEVAAFRNEISEIRKSARENEKNYNLVQEDIHKCEMELERLNSKRKSIVERIWEEYEKDLNTIPEGENRLDIDIKEAKERIDVLKKRLKAIGPNVNLSVLEDYEEAKTVYDELFTQKNDLESAKDKLEQLIKKLDKEACDKFVETFNQVRENFKNVFLSLFEGGEADIRLEGDSDPLKAKIVIYARPSGKSMKSIHLLSGGERALTATSLLFGLYLVKESPYCILDEVDGPLDDANIGRFINLIRQFSKKTQFLVISHNKKTMAACDVLYGVTLVEPGVSKTVSVNLSLKDEDKEIDKIMRQGVVA